MSQTRDAAMAEQLAKFSGDDFNPEKYVRDVSQVCVGGLELQKHKMKIQQLADDTSHSLKKNVYQNYMQFIETAREISHLEGEMYQLSHLLSDQRTLLASMGSAPQNLPVKEEEEKEDDQESARTGRLEAVSEKVENCPDLLDMPGRDLLYEGDLVELDPIEFSALHRCHAFLFSDMLIVAIWISNRRGPAKYKFEISYDLSSLAVVNVRDLERIKHAFKLLHSDADTRLFQCANSQAKEDWLNQLDEVKKQRMEVEQRKREKVAEKGSPVRADSVDSGTNPFLPQEDDDEELPPEWVCEAPEDIDVFLAQRHFEEAYSLIQKAYSYFNEDNSSPIVADLNNKVNARVNNLTQILLNELRPNDRSLQGGLRASRRAVKLLNQLGKSKEACELYLRLCTNFLKAQMKRVKKEGATTAYVRRLSGVFFSTLASITIEFGNVAFPHSSSCASAFIVWTSTEVSNFTNHLVKQIFMPQTPLNTLAESMSIVRKEYEKLVDLGLDLGYQLEGQVISSIARSLNETRDKLIDAVKLRCSEDTWHPSQHGKAALHKLQEQFVSSGLPSITSYATGDGWLELTVNTVSFCKLYWSFLEDGLLICTPDLEYNLSLVLKDVLEAHLGHVVTSLHSDKLRSQRNLIHKNATFLIDHFLKACMNKYLEKTGHRCQVFDQIVKKFSPAVRETVVRTVTGYI